MLTIYAGPKAKQQLLENGFTPSLFTTFLGASGGPKWFSLYGLDRYMFGEFFAGRTQPLQLVGSSAGAFRSACFAQADPVAAIERLAKHYSTTTYSDKPTASEITEKARDLLDIVVPPHGVDEIIQNPVYKAHFIVAKVNGLAAKENRPLQMLGLIKSLVANRVNRRLIRNQYQRIVYGSPSSEFEFVDDDQFETQFINFTRDNLAPALLASGSIPLVMEGIRDIPNSPRGMYRDGGIIDYHFDLNINSRSGLVLYPHFNASPRAGWFDKSLNRRVRAQNYDNVVMLVPSERFVRSLPYGKIPDREDFTKMDTDQRIDFWQTVLKETERLADDFADLVKNIEQRTIHDIDAR